MGFCRQERVCKFTYARYALYMDDQIQKHQVLVGHLYHRDSHEQDTMSIHAHP